MLLSITHNRTTVYDKRKSRFADVLFLLQALLVVFFALCCLARPASAGRRRTLFTGKSLSDRFLGYDEQTNTNDAATYGLYVAERAAICALIGVLHLLFIPLYLIWRLCRLCICKPKKDGFSKGCVRVLKLMLVGGALVAVGLFVSGTSLNAVFHSGIVGSVRGVKRQGTRLFNDWTTTQNRVLSQSRTRDEGESLAPVTNSVRTILDNIDEADKFVTKYMDLYRKYVYIAFAVMACILVLGSFLGFFNLTACAILRIIGLFAVLITFVFLLVAALHILMWFLFTDMCREVDIRLAKITADDLNAEDPIAKALGCDSSTFEPVLNVVNPALDQARSETCTLVESMCAGANAACTAGPCTSSNATEYGSQLFVIGTLSVSFADCVTQCPASSTEQAQSLNYATLSQEIANFTDIVNENILPLLDCGFIDDMVNGLRRDICKTATRGLKGVTLCLLLFSLVADVLTVTYFYGTQRFGKVAPAADAPELAEKDYAYEYQYVSEDGDDGATSEQGDPETGDEDEEGGDSAVAPGNAKAGRPKTKE